MIGSDRWKRLTAITAGGIVLVSLAAMLLAYLAARPPGFYHQIDRMPAQDREAESRQFVRGFTDLWNEIENEPAWSSRFLESHVNAWLATDFPLRHPGALPEGVSDPRVCFEKGRISVAFRKRRGPVAAIISVAGRVWLPEPNLMAIELERFRAGAIPLPSGQVMGTLSSAARAAGLDLEWKQHAGNPVALLRLTTDDAGDSIQIDRVSIEPGALHIGGRARGRGAIAQRAGEAADARASGSSRSVQLSEPSLSR